MFQKTCERCAPWGLTLLRISVGAILIVHGWPKLFGDTTQLLAFFESTVLPAPSLMLIAAGLVEVFGGALLILGLFTRYVAALIALEFAVILLFVKLQLGWSKLEFDLLIFASTLALMSSGAGKFSVDSFLCKQQGNGKGAHGGQGSEAITG